MNDCLVPLDKHNLITAKATSLIFSPFNVFLVATEVLFQTIIEGCGTCNWGACGSICISVCFGYRGAFLTVLIIDLLLSLL